jgi:phosphocarrier protein FPr/phosphocarrier protein
MIDSAALSFTLTAPLDGWAAPLAEVPDTVFAARMMGDGIAIDPTGSVVTAPCDGQIMHLHHAHHAVTLRSLFGAEILIHVGLETVALGGEGFIVHVIEGQSVKAGDKLISFDLDQVARGAKSLITPIIVTNGDEFAIETRAEGRSVTAGQPLLSLRRIAAAASSAASGGTRQASRTVTVPLAHGIHARPAARLADLAKSHEAEIIAVWRERRANLKSPVALMALGIVKGTELRLDASGPDADAAVAAIAALIESGMGEREADHPAPLPVQHSTKPSWVEPGVVAGVRAAPGLALGIAFHLKIAEILVPEAGQGAAAEQRRLTEALGAVRARLTMASQGRGPASPGGKPSPSRSPCCAAFPIRASSSASPICPISNARS